MHGQQMLTQSSRCRWLGGCGKGCGGMHVCCGVSRGNGTIRESARGEHDMCLSMIYILAGGGVDGGG